MKTIAELLANLRGVIETDQDIRGSDLFKAMEQARFDPAHPIKVRKSDGLLICGYHRSRCAEMLGLEPVKLFIDCTDEEAIQIAVRDNTYSTAPITMDRRKAMAQQLYPAHTMKAIADMLDVTEKTISVWLADIVTQGKNVERPRKTDSLGRKASTGRPKKQRKAAPKHDKARDVVRPLVEAGQAVSRDKLAAEHGLTHGSIQRAELAERARLEAMADPVIDPATLSLSAQEKYAAAVRQTERKIQRSLNAQFHDAVREQLAAAMNSLVASRYKDLHAKYDRVLNRRRGQGTMTPAEYRLVLSCLHPDSRGATSERKIAEAFGVIQKHKLSLVSESVEPTPTPHDLPKTAAEWMEAKRKATEARRAKRNGSAVVSR